MAGDAPAVDALQQAHPVAEEVQADPQLLQARMRALLSQAPLATQVLGTDGVTKAANPAFYRLWGITPEVLASYNLFQDPQLEAKGILPQLRRAFAGEPVQLQPVRYDPAESGNPGRPRWVRSVAYPVLGHAGQVQEVIVQHEDVTEQVEAVEALRASEQHYRLLVDGLQSHAIVLLDRDGRIASWSEGARLVSGYAAEEVLGRTFAMFYPKGSGPDVDGLLQRVREEGRVEEEGWRLRKDGSRYWASMFTTALHDSTGNLRGYARVVRDNTERKRFEDDLQEAYRRLRESEAARTRLLNMAAHELKTPLTPVKLQLVLLRAHEQELPPAQRRSLQVLERNIGRLERIVEDVLDAVRIEGGGWRLAMVPVDIAELVREAVEAFRDATAASDVTLRHRATAPLPVYADVRRLSQVLLNLLGNALRCTPDGGTIDVEALREGSHVTVHVRDTGIGLSAQDMDVLFRPFSQVEQARGEGSLTGSGLGLFLSKAIVEAHGGRIWAESDGRGRGARFSFSLPATSDPLPERQADEQPSPAPTADDLRTRIRAAL